MAEAYIIDALRTPVGRKAGGLSTAHPADLGAHVIRALVERTGVDPLAVDDVVFGCLDTVGPNAGDIARTCWLAAGLPEAVPGTTIDRQCGSSQQAVHFAAQGVMSGTQDIVVAGGVQNMSMVPIGTSWALAKQFDQRDPFNGSHGWRARYGDAPVNQFMGAERIAAQWDLSRESMERFALESHRRALAAMDAGLFEREIVPYGEVRNDEGARRDSSLEKLASLKTIMPEGRLTAALSSQISDGAAALLVVSERALKQYGWKPLARIHHMSVRGDDPIIMLTAPIPATRHAFAKSGLSMKDIAHVEINEAFASVPMAWIKELDVDPAIVNPLGGAIALGHPLGATGARLMTTLVWALQRSGARYGLQTMCEGGGQANVTILERL
jgi:acetyl-CoA C-acetyltransferase